MNVVGADRRSMARLVEYLESQSSKRVRKTTTATRLEKAIQMRSQAMSATIAMSGKVDLESNTKGQASRVDMAKLAKAEAKLHAKIEKRSKRDLYQGSKLLDAHVKQQSYEEMYMKVNPLDLTGAAKGKSKDIQLSNIDVSFASNKILSGANLTMAYGRRYGSVLPRAVQATQPASALLKRRMLTPAVSSVGTVSESRLFCAIWPCEKSPSPRISPSSTSSRKSSATRRPRSSPSCKQTSGGTSSSRKRKSSTLSSRLWRRNRLEKTQRQRGPPQTRLPRRTSQSGTRSPSDSEKCRRSWWRWRLRLALRGRVCCSLVWDSARPSRRCRPRASREVGECDWRWRERYSSSPT